MSQISKKILMIAIIGAAIAPIFASAASQPKFYYGGWIPFWNKTLGVRDITNNLGSELNQISPFSYEVKYNGVLVDKLKISEGFWPNWLSAIHDLRIKITPTIAWFDGNAIHKLLSNKKKRIAHEDAIAALAKNKNFDGIDIDYEAKKSETKQYFSLFIQGLAMRLHALKKTLSCTVEARTPAESLYYKITPPKIERANDYGVLDKYCDEVRVMAYDQAFVDRRLNAERGSNGALYAPIADPEWVKKVITETNKGIRKNKIMLGIPTYGYEYEINTIGATTTYKRVQSVTYDEAIKLANSVGIIPQRNIAGELSFTYSTSSAFSNPPVSARRLVWFSDAEAIADKIKLAKQFKLRGVVFFKLDGEADPAIWEKIK